MRESKVVSIDEIRPSPYQPRVEFDDEALMELSQSIRENGLIHPITVRKENDGYEIVAGERRYRAMKIAGMLDIPVIVIDADEVQMAEMALVENIQRENLSAIEEAKAYVQKLRTLLTAAGVSDCRMQEGSLRVDVNLSVRRKGDSSLGTRTEMKNLNSVQFMAKAIQYEADRQVQVLESGGRVEQETRRYNQETGRTEVMRRKEEADDYRYFPDPDLLAVRLSRDETAEIASRLPELPDERCARYRETYGLPIRDAELLSQDLSVSRCFEEAAAKCKSPKLAANILISNWLPLFDPAEEKPFPPLSAQLAQLADLFEAGRISSSTVKVLTSLRGPLYFDHHAFLVCRGSSGP